MGWIGSWLGKSPPANQNDRIEPPDQSGPIAVPQPSRLGELARKAVDLVRARVVHAVETSEREILAVGECLQDLMTQAQRQSAILRQMEGDIGDGSAMSGALHRQKETVSRFVEGLVARASEQQALAQAAHERTQRIGEAGHRIQNIATHSRLLSFNAQMEAARLGSRGHAFQVIAKEIRELAAEVEKTNALIAELADDVAMHMPKLDESAGALREEADRFSDAVDDGLREVDAAQASVRERFFASLRDSEVQAEQTVASSGAALSHLQFQDPVSQAMRQALVVLDHLVDSLALGEKRVEGLEMALRDGRAKMELPALSRDPIAGAATAAAKASDEMAGDGEEAPLASGEVLLF